MTSTKPLRSRLATLTAPAIAAFGLAITACAPLPPAELADDDIVKGEDNDGDGKADTSVEATILDFEWDGELVTGYATVAGARSIIQDQLLYTIGHLNGNRAVGRLDRLDLTAITVAASMGGKTRVTYHARMPVAWGAKTNLPSSYAFALPRDVSYEGTAAFTTKYKASCVDFGAHDVDSGSMWYYYRPAAGGCQLAEADVVRATAKVAVSRVNTSGKFPEYHKVWEDGAFNVVAVFGKYEDGATTSADAGIAAYAEFVGAVRKLLAANQPTTIPAQIPAAPGVMTPDIEFQATLPGNRKVRVNVLLVDKVSTAPQAFYDRYEGLSTRADLIVYNGHAGLGQNVRALARRGRFVAGQYAIVFMNGCDTYAYVDGSLAETRGLLNRDDPSGTKYMEIVTNAMPAYFRSDAGATMALLKGLLDRDNPTTYEQIFRNIDRAQVVLVTGEEDNVFVPGYQPGGGNNNPPPWAGLMEAGTVLKSAERRFTTPTLAAGSYSFQMTGTGDADLYVRIGSAPTTKTYDCRPYKAGSQETCVVRVPSAAAVHVMVRGYAATSNFTLVGKPQ